MLINNASMNAYVAEPFASAYVACKFAVRGLADSLRAEWLDEPGIHICTVLPAVIDTPLFQHAANYEGRAPRAMPPVYAPERVAEGFVHLAEGDALARAAGRDLGHRHSRVQAAGRKSARSRWHCAAR